MVVSPARAKNVNARIRSSVVWRIPSPVVPPARTPPTPPARRNSAYGSNAPSSSSEPPARYGVTAAASAPFRLTSSARERRDRRKQEDENRDRERPVHIRLPGIRPIARIEPEQCRRGRDRNRQAEPEDDEADEGHERDDERGTAGAAVEARDDDPEHHGHRGGGHGQHDQPLPELIVVAAGERADRGQDRGHDERADREGRAPIHGRQRTLARGWRGCGSSATKESCGSRSRSRNGATPSTPSSSAS